MYESLVQAAEVGDTAVINNVQNETFDWMMPYQKDKILAAAVASGHEETALVIVNKCTQAATAFAYMGMSSALTQVAEQGMSSVIEALESGQLAYRVSPYERGRILTAAVANGHEETAQAFVKKLNGITFQAYEGLGDALTHAAKKEMSSVLDVLEPIHMSSLEAYQVADLLSAVVVNNDEKMAVAVLTKINASAGCSYQYCGQALTYAAEQGMTNVIEALDLWDFQLLEPFEREAILMAAVANGHEETALAFVEKFHEAYLFDSYACIEAPLKQAIDQGMASVVEALDPDRCKPLTGRCAVWRQIVKRDTPDFVHQAVPTQVAGMSAAAKPQTYVPVG